MSYKTFLVLLLFPMGMVACATMQTSTDNNQQQSLSHFVEEPQTTAAAPAKAFGPDPNERRDGAYAEKSPVLSSMGMMMKISPLSSAGSRIYGSSEPEDEGRVCIYCRHQL